MYARTMYVIYLDYIFHHSFTMYPQSTINPFQLHNLSLRQILIWTAHILVGVCVCVHPLEHEQPGKGHSLKENTLSLSPKAIIQQLGVEAHEPVTALCRSTKCLELTQLLRGDHSCLEVISQTSGS